MENEELFTDDLFTNSDFSDQVDSDNVGIDDLQSGDDVSIFVDLQPIIDRLDTIESLLSVDPEPVSNDSVHTFNSLDQALLFLILIVATCIFLFRGKK